MRAMLSSVALVLLLGAGVGCGGSTHDTPTSSRAVASTGASTETSSKYNGPLTVQPGKRLPMSGYEPPTHVRGLKGDGDQDSSMWDDGYRAPDNDEDPALDHRPSDANEGYRDADDLDSLRVGIPMNAADTKAIEALVRRYYAVAMRGEGAKACSMMTRSFANSVPLDYGKFGAAYLHAGKTCAQIASLQFRHSHSQIPKTLFFTAVHLENASRAYALFGSRTAPAGFIAIDREAGVWKIGALLGRSMP
jgi:hypothetical protein